MARPCWDPGWEADLVIEFDADFLNEEEVTNLLYRAGRQVGIGEGRPMSPKSNGCGWGRFDVVGAYETPTADQIRERMGWSRR